ncbi:hypothetical protein ACJ7V3_16475 [Halomonas elongata]|uniref:hypothetical protein n=1 Tax=Halomonas elongata TaxID=2746 RepID=UPI0038D39F28
MGLKKLLWNDNATELFGHRRDQDEHVAPGRPEEGTASHRSHTARKVLKGSAAFTSALLFGNGESQGLVRTLGEATAEAGKNLFKSRRQIDMENALRNHEEGMREQRRNDGIGMNAYTGRFSHEIDKYYDPKD